MVSPVTIYAIAASGLFVTFVLPFMLTIWWRRRLLKTQQANANSILEATPTSIPEFINPLYCMTPRPRSVYLNKPGGSNVEFLLLDQNSTPTFGGDRTSISPLPSLGKKPQEPNYTQPPPAYTEV